MATITRRIGGDGDPVRGFVSFEIDYDDVALRLLAVRCINNSTEAAWGQATSVTNPNRVYSGTFPANQTTTFDVPTGASRRLEVSFTPNGKIDGVDYSFMWPAP